MISMYNNQIYILLIFLVCSCKDIESKKNFDFTNSTKYNIQYNFEVSFQLTVFEDNDTIYLVDMNKSELKIKSDYKINSQIKNLAINHFNFPHIDKDSSKLSESDGFLFISINNKSNSIISNQTELSSKFETDILNLYNQLKNKY